MQMGLREVNQHFAVAVRAIREGEEVVIMDRGRPFALLTPLREDDAIERMVRSGFLTPPSGGGAMRAATPTAVSEGTTAQLLAEERSGW